MPKVTKAMRAAEAALQPPGPENYLCQQCRLWDGCKSPFLRDYAYKASQGFEVMFVGSQPTAHDMLQRMQFDSPVGRLFRQNVLKPIGLKPSQCSFVSAVACHSTRGPNADQIKQCRAFVMQTILERLPHKIVLLGADAARSVLNIKDPVLKDLTCKIHKVDVGDEHNWISIPTLVTYSMNYMLKEPGVIDVIRGHIQRFVQETMATREWPTMEVV